MLPHFKTIRVNLHFIIARILRKGEIKPPDYDDFIQCYECGNIYPIHETFTESKIKDSVQTSSNPFENEPIFLSTDSRATERKKGIKRKSRFHTEEYEDPEIQAELKKGNIVQIIEGV